MPHRDPSPSPAVREALALLDVQRLLLGLPDRCFPSTPDEDTSTGTRARAGLLALVRRLGFTGIQLGPQGETSPADASPYTGALFSRARLGVALARLADDEAWGALLDRAELERIVAARPPGRPDRVAYAYAHRVHREALGSADAAFTAHAGAQAAPVAARLAAFAADQRDWLERDGLYEVLQEAAGGRHWSEWPDVRDRLLWRDDAGARARREAHRGTHREALARYAFAQLVAHVEHDAFRRRAHALGLEVWGDLQVGVSERDWWGHPDLFLEGYALGAPPSRTNPEGQAWDYPVLDPGRPEAVARFVAARAAKTFAEYDGVRIDHPQGLVCPWVYRPDGHDPLAAVRRGARLRDARRSAPAHGAVRDAGASAPLTAARPFRTRMGMRALALVLLALAGAARSRAEVPGGGLADADCRVVFGGVDANAFTSGVVCTDGDPACDADGTADGTCRFAVRVCTGRSTNACSTVPLSSVTVAGLPLDPPDLSGPDGTCGASLPVAVPVGTASGATVIARQGTSLRDVDYLNLCCARADDPLAAARCALGVEPSVSGCSTRKIPRSARSAFAKARTLVDAWARDPAHRRLLQHALRKLAAVRAAGQRVGKHEPCGLALGLIAGYGEDVLGTAQAAPAP